MDKFKPSGGKQGEKIIQDNIEGMLRMKGWFVLRTHGNLYQSGLPDIFACHSMYGQRWIEVKLPEMKGSRFTPAQMDVFPKLAAHGSAVWILTSATEKEYQKLMSRPNLFHYMGLIK